MNHILSTQPDGTPPTFVFGSPRWLVLGFRGFLFVGGAITAVVSVQHWSVMPPFARLLGALLAPALLAWSAWSQPWRYNTRFIANETGMYFPAYPPLTLSAPKTQVEVAWLAVPWKHISNIRVATESGEDGKCIAFDIQASASEKSRFFAEVGIPRDRKEHPPAAVSVAYGGWPPSPVRTVQELLNLSARGEV